MTTFLAFFAMLVVAHAMADYPLQGDYLAARKNPWLVRTLSARNDDHSPWWWAMTMHCSIHGGFVWFVTGVWWLGLIEVIAHFFIDYAKCRGLFTASQDQGAHIGCKVFYALMATSLGASLS